MAFVSPNVAARGLPDRTLFALAILNFFLADARDGLGPFLDAFLATNGWSPLALGFIATIGGIIGLLVTPLFGAVVDGSKHKRALIVVPVLLVTAAALVTLIFPQPAVVWVGQVGTAVVGAIIGPALMGLTLGLVGERLFPRQVSRNEFWNHLGNFASLFAVFVIVSAFGENGVIWLMIATAIGAILAIAFIDPNRIDHDVARGLTKKDEGKEGPSGYKVLISTPGLILIALILLIFHFGNAPMSRLIAKEFAIELGTPFRTTALITGVAQLTMVAVAAATPFLIRRLGLTPVFIVALCALPLRGFIAGTFSDFSAIYPIQMLDGIGAGLLGILTPVAVERLMSGTGRFNVGLAAVMTVQGVGASLSNVVAGTLVTWGGYSLSHYVGGGVAVITAVLFLVFRRQIVQEEAASAP